MKRKCTGRKKNGDACNNWAIKGGLVCRNHGGSAPQVRAKATLRAELATWGLDGHDETVDPGSTLLRLLTQSAVRAEVYAQEIRKQVDEHGLQDALTGDSMIMDPQSGTLTKVGEYVRAMAQLEFAERDRCAKFSKLALDAGIAERQVKLAEREGALIEQVLSAAFEQIGLSAQQRAEAPAAIRAALALVS